MMILKKSFPFAIVLSWLVILISMISNICQAQSDVFFENQNHLKQKLNIEITTLNENEILIHGQTEIIIPLNAKNTADQPEKKISCDKKLIANQDFLIHPKAVILNSTSKTESNFSEKLNSNSQTPNKLVCIWTVEWNLKMDHSDAKIQLNLFPSDLWYPQFNFGSPNHKDLVDSEFVRYQLNLNSNYLKIFSNAISNIAINSMGNLLSYSPPQEGVWLIYTNYPEKKISPFKYYVSKENQSLIPEFQKTLEHYLQIYEKLFGPYLYSEFAVVENTDETGYGMPGFTLLGQKVLQLPFLTYSSLPHELLHNWWGNGVFVDTAFGNWSESMTTYFSDQWIAESQGQGPGYRRKSLQNYLTFKSQGGDFPIKDFRERHDNITQAVGYNKGLMVLKMLEFELSSNQGVLENPRHKWIECAEKFYLKYQFQKASFKDLFNMCSAVSGKDLNTFFHQWIETIDVPEIKATILTAPELIPGNKNQGYQLKIKITQAIENSIHYLNLKLPYLVEFTDGEIFKSYFPLNKNQHDFTLQLYKKPKKLILDPEFEMVRILDLKEIPPQLQEVFSQKFVHIFTNKANLPNELIQYLNSLNIQYKINPSEENSERNSRNFNEVSSIYINDSIEQGFIDFPNWKNQLTSENLILDNNNNVKYEDLFLDKTKNTWAFTFRGTTKTHLWLQLESADAIQTLFKKIRHYGSFSAVGFDNSKKVLNLEWKKNQNSPFYFLFPD